MNTAATFSFMGMTCGVLSDNQTSLQASLDCVMHVAEHVRREYPSADITQVLILTSLRMGEILCNAQRKDEQERLSIHDYQLFVERIVALLASV